MNTDPTPAQTRHEYAAELAKTMQCNCDLDNWEPERSTGHSHVCRIHKAALQWSKPPATPSPSGPAQQNPNPPARKSHRWSPDGETCIDCGDKDWRASSNCESTPTPPQPAAFLRAMEGNYQPCDYPEDAEHENGNYATKCLCGIDFIGHKRRVLCKVCAERPAPELTAQACGFPDLTNADIKAPQLLAPTAPQTTARDSLTAADLLDDNTCGELACNTCNDQRGLAARLLRIETSRADATESRAAMLDQEGTALRVTIENLRTELAAAQAESAKLREALEWYSDRVEKYRLQNLTGYGARNELGADGRQRGRAALTQNTDAEKC